MMSRSPQCYIPSFVKIGPLVPEQIFEVFSISWSCVQYHVNIIFISMYPKVYIHNLIENDHAVTEKSNFLNDLGQGKK